MAADERRLSRALPAPLRAAEDRLHLSSGLHSQLNKVFPARWSFLLGEVALYSFVVLLLSGTYLALFFDPSMEKVTYDGAYVPLQGLTVSRAFASSVDLSFEVRGGLLIRQFHHWAALVFVAAILVHMARIFTSGAFRRPREANWLVGILLLVLAVVEGFAGYSLPDDLLSGTGLRIASAIILSIPVVGTWTHWALFGGEFPGEVIIPRLFTVHIFVIPALMAALVAVHLALVWRQKHTQARGARATERNVVGTRIVPEFAAKSTALFIAVNGVLLAMAGAFQINPIWNYGPYQPNHVSAGSQPDWYLAWVDGAARLWPAWELQLFGHRVPAVFWPTVVLPSTMVLLAMAYPWLERRLTRDTAHHNLIDRNRDKPVRTALGAMSLTFFLVLLASGFNDLLAMEFDISLNAMVWMGRLGLLLLPPLAYAVTYRYCLGLADTDREVLEDGIETGVVVRREHGGYVAVHQPLASVGDDGERPELHYAGTPVPKRLNDLGLSGSPVSGGLFRPDPPGETRALRRTTRDGQDDGE